MRIIFCNYNDYSNLTYGWGESLKSVGVDSHCFTLTRHDFAYSKQAEYVSQDRMLREMQRADIVVIGHSQRFLMEMVKPLNKRVYIAHTGTPYRQAHEDMNTIFNPYVTGTLTDSPEFMTLGAKNIQYVAAAIDTDYYEPYVTLPLNKIFAHFPSKASNKGTETIRRIFKELNAEIWIDENNVSHQENIFRIRDCDIYVEMFQPEQDGKPYGSFGVTAFEAAAMNKIVITNCAHEGIYKQAYGCNPVIIVCNNENDFKLKVSSIIKFGSPLLKSPREWIINTHGYNATGLYLKKVLGL